jgi:ABC-2 type transport system permease protein
MAGLDRSLPPISAAQQFRAIAYLRWRLFANGFRRKGGTGELVARIIVYPIGFIFLLGPTIGAGAGAWAAVSSGHLDVLSVIFWAITALQIIVSINIAQPGLSFDPESLIRFPVSFPRYLVVRLFLGLLSASTIVGTCALLAAALGTTIARPDLGLIVFAAAILLAIANMLFIRMIFAWIDRWLSTRRARELFTGVIILFSIGIQYLNVTFNTGFNRRDPAAQRRKIAAATHFYHASQSILSHFPAGLAGISVVNVAHAAIPYALANLLAIALFAALFLAVFAWRMQREYRGENLSDSGSLAHPQTPTARIPANDRVPHLSRSPIAAEVGSQPSAPTNTFLPPALTACFYKEWIYVRRNTAQLYGMLGPLAMVFLFAGKMGNNFRTSMWIFPGAMAYAMLGIAALSYNALGLDAEGTQFYFLVPVRMHSIMLAKNLFGFAIALIEAVVVYAVLCIVARPPAPLITIATLCWLVFAILVNVTIGNMRSIIAPKKMDPSKLSRRQASQLSGLMSIGIFLVLGAIGAGILFLASFLDQPWLPIPIFLALAIGALALYITGLNKLDDLALTHRETMLEELCKAS